MQFKVSRRYRKCDGSCSPSSSSVHRKLLAEVECDSGKTKETRLALRSVTPLLEFAVAWLKWTCLSVEEIKTRVVNSITDVPISLLCHVF